MKSITKVIFDLDGTLINSSDVIVECFNQVLRESGEHEADPAAIRATIGMPLDVAFALFTERDTAPLADRFRELALPIMPARTELLPGADAALALLSDRGYGLAVASTKSRAFCQEILAALGLTQYFAAIVGGDEIANGKPAPDLIVLTLRRLSAEPGEAAYIGDSPLDVNAGRAAGVATIGVKTGYRPPVELEAAKPDFLCEDVLEAAELVAAHR